MERTTPVGASEGSGRSGGGGRLAALGLAAALAVGPLTARVRGADPTPQQVQQQQEQDRKAAAVLNDAKQAYEQKNYGQSVAKYREFLQQFPKRPEAVAAQYGLAMALVEAPGDKDWASLVTTLQPVVASPEVPDKGRAHYWLGSALRVTGEQQLAAVTKPAEQKEQLAKALERIGQAGAQYALADAALSTALKPASADMKELPPQTELVARAKVEGAEAFNKVGKHKEAADLVKPFATDATWQKSGQRNAGLLALGQAQVALGEYAAATAALAQLAPFDQPGIGLHARHLLGRILQETGERPEAVVQYEAVVKEYPAQRKKAEQALQNREPFKGKPFELARVEAMVRGVPEYVALSNLKAAEIQFGYGQIGEAAPKFQAYLQAAPKSELAPVAQVKLGACFAQLKQTPEAMRALQPLAEHPQLGDQVTWWIGRLQRATVDPANADQQRKQLQGAAATFAKAAEKAAAMGRADPAALARRGDILLDHADTLAQLKQFKEAAPIYEGLANDSSNAERAEIAHERWAMALAKDGQSDAGNAAAAKFLEKYPRSMLRPTVQFWQAENAYRQGVELAKKGDAASIEQANKLQSQAAAQFQAVVDKYPEFAQASAARFGVGMTHYRQGQWEKAVKQLRGVLDADRTGDLLMASYYQADCLLRTLPESADDALSAAKLAAQLDEAAKLLGGFVGSNEERPEMPDAMLKLADACQRSAAILADQQEKARLLKEARETYDKLLQKYPKHPAFAEAVMDRARCIAATGDPGGAINELNRFRGEPALVKSDAAPLALVRLAELMVKHGRAVDAAAMLDKARKDYEPQLAQDPKRAPLIAGLRYQHGMALKESGKAKDALTIFEGVIKEYADRPEAAEASLASIQVRKDEAVAKLKVARQAVAGAPADTKLLDGQAEAVKQVVAIATALGEHAERLAEKAAGSDLHVRTLRDAARSWQAVAEVELDAARRAKSAESLAKLKERVAKEPQVGKSNTVPRPPEIELASIPVQPAEQKVREACAKALEAAPDSPVCNELRLEMAQAYFDRGEADQAIQLLSAAIDRNPPADQLQQLRVKLGSAYVLKKDADGAMAIALKALEDTNSPLRPAAYLVKGKAQMLQKNWGEAVTTLSRYRAGAEKYVNAGPITEEGLMCLADAYAQAGAWDESRATYEHFIARFGQSRWVPEARFGIGLALQKAKQFDPAIVAFTDVTRRTSSELAAKAQLQIGLCRAEQKRWQDAVDELLTVPGTYDYADSAARASLEAGKALVQLNQPAQAKDVLKRVVRDHPGTEWAQQAEKRIAEIQ
jgi:tetratricopeptide (TPR) repeat protein